MVTTATYQILKNLIEERLLVVRHSELIRLLDNLQRQGHVTEEENKALQEVAEHLKLYDLPLAA